jgi:DNA-binding MarR family transcriptional regulator
MEPIARLLSAATRSIIEDLHDRLAAQGHPDLRPAYGYALNAVGDGVTTAQLAQRLGMTKQGAAKLVTALERLGYLRVEPHASDRRARALVLTPHGRDLLERSVAVQRELEAEWSREVGPERMAALQEALAARAGDGALKPLW